MKHDFIKKAGTVSVMLAVAMAGYLIMSGLTAQRPGTPRPGAGLPDFVPVARAVAPSFVHIATQYPEDRQIPSGAKDYHLDLSGPTAAPLRRGVGSGIIIHRDGHILTNYHVVEGANQVIVRLADRRAVDAAVVGHDARSDIALIKIAASNPLEPARLGDSSLLQAGDWVVAMGSPFGLDRTFTAGIVSAKARRIPASAYYEYIQTDTSINPGNSGGPLLDLHGRVIGINTAMLSNSGANLGINFALPINLIKNFLPALLTKGKITRGWLGVSTRVVTPQIARSLGLEKPGGALIVHLDAAGPAMSAGLEPGDVIVAYDGKAIVDAGVLPGLVADTRVGRRVTLFVNRHGIIYRVLAAIGELREPEAAASGLRSRDDA
jgi:serine protease Do